MQCVIRLNDYNISFKGSLDGTIKIWDVNKVSSSNMEMDHVDITKFVFECLICFNR